MKSFVVQGDAWGRRCMTPREFDQASNRLMELFPGLSQTSGARSDSRNQRVGGAEGSKHAIRRRVAQDYALENPDGSPMTNEQRERLIRACKVLGFWAVIHDAGSGDHLHTQGLPPGPIPELWWALFGDE